MANPLWCVIWFLVLIFPAFPIAFLCAFLYIICYFFGSCIDGCKGLLDILLSGIQLPGTALNKMVKCEGC